MARHAPFQRTQRLAARPAKGRRASPGLAALALLCLLAQATSYLHVAIVQHVQCPEHGELVHLGPPAAGTHPAEPGEQLSGSADAQAAAAAPTLLAMAPSPSWTHDEGHCLIGFSQGSRTGLGPSGSSFALPSDTKGSSLAADSTPRVAAVPIYRFAPKGSPPV